MTGQLVRTARWKRLLPAKDLSARGLWRTAFALAALKIVLCGQQLVYAFPDASPIDDELMLNFAKSITAGNWLGEYGWLTLGKHSFYALWLALMNLLHMNIIVGGQILFAAGCLVLLAALRPVLRTGWARLFVFAVVLYTPASWAEHTMRVYRDSIYPSLVLLALAGLLGAFVRVREPVSHALPYLAAAGFSLAAAWLCHEDNALLLPFLLCGAAVYAAALFCSRDITRRGARLALLLVPLAVWSGGVAAWRGMNAACYGRFIVSDFTSREFEDAMGALSRAYPDDQTRYVLVPRSTRFALYEVSPTFALLRDTLETEPMYKGYGDPDAGEFNSGGIHWALRRAAWMAGFYETAETAEAFWRNVADEINAACDAGLVPAGPEQSGIFSPIKPEYIGPTLGKFFEEIRVFLLFEQTNPRAPLTWATQERLADWDSYTHCTSSGSAIPYTDIPYYPRPAHVAYAVLDGFTWVQRVLLWPMLALAAVWLCRFLPRFVRAVRKRELTPQLAGGMLLFGFFLTGLLRMAAIAYLLAVSMSIDISLMYLSPACAPMLAFLACASALWAERRFGFTDELAPQAGPFRRLIDAAG